MITYTAKSDDEDVEQIFVNTIEELRNPTYQMQREMMNQFKFIKKEDKNI